MAKAQNFYEYKTPKSGDYEVSYFIPKGRIRRRIFFLRLLLVAVLLVISNLVMEFYFADKYIYWQNFGHGEVRNKTFLIQYNVFFVFNFYILPILLALFLLIQGAKRMHDVNKSGWWFLVPLYNIVLSFFRGTVGQNNYGIDPKPAKKVKYYDELKTEE